MYDERQFVVDSFVHNFKEYIGKRIVIYGLGKNTKAILENCTEFNIIGLMDGFKKSGFMWGLPIFSCNQLKENKVELIIIVATSTNVPIIYERIAQSCKQNKVKVYDINGKDLKEENSEYIFPEYYQYLTKESLLELIKKYDVISFDIFDTLLVRDVLYPTDVFMAVEKECKSILPEHFSFYDNRINAERELYLQGNPTIDDIYEYFEIHAGIPHETVECLKRTEIDKEKMVLQTREEMLNILFYAHNLGKIICCTSDMYLKKDMLKELLNENGIIGIDDVFVSCECGVSKNNGLFQILRERYSRNTILHIGDNYDSDILSATKYGIDATFKISSVYQMFLDSKLKSIFSKCETYSERCLLGKLIAKQFNNPFLFSETKGKAKILSNYECGYFFLEPLLEVFTKWLMKKTEEENVDYLLLGARDGWIIKEILDLERQAGNWKIPYSYFYASRLACSLAGMKTREDVLYVAEQTFDGTIKEKLKKRFLIPDDMILKYSKEDDEKSYFNKHIPMILSIAEKRRKNYKRYIQTLKLEGEKIAFFDFISSGTCQLWLNKILDKELIGYYVARNIDRYKLGLKINSLYKPRFVYEEQGELFKNFIFLEAVLTSMEPTLKEFSDDGTSVFFEEERNGKVLNGLQDIHKGIIDGYRDRMKTSKCDDISPKFAECLVEFVRSEYTIWNDSFYEKNELADEFCNRKFDLQKVMKNK